MMPIVIESIQLATEAIQSGARSLAINPPGDSPDRVPNLPTAVRHPRGVVALIVQQGPTGDNGAQRVRHDENPVLGKFCRPMLGERQSTIDDGCRVRHDVVEKRLQAGDDVAELSAERVVLKENQIVTSGFGLTLQE